MKKSTVRPSTVQKSRLISVCWPVAEVKEK
jgi:hypothetical protein